MGTEIVAIEEIANLSSNELKALFTEYNTAQGLKTGDLGYMKKGSKSDMIDQILVNDALNETAGEVVLSGAPVRTDVQVSQVSIHCDNFRHALDYEDPDLQAAFRNGGYHFFHDVVVTPTGEDNADGLPTYRIVSGNRSYANFVAVCEEDGVDLTGVTVPVSIRVYEGTPQQQRVAELQDIAKGNELQLAMSPVDRCKQYNAMSRAGYNQKAIARAVYGDNAKGKQPVISQIMRLRLLPDRVLDLVHFNSQARRLENHTEEFLTENNVPFVVDETTSEITVLGITMENAKAMNKLWPKVKNPDREEIEGLIIGLLEREDTIENAVSMTAGAFNSWLRAEAGKLGILAKKRTTEVSTDGDDSTTDDDSTSETTDDDSTSTTSSRAPYLQTWSDEGISIYEFAADLENDEKVFADDAAQKLAEALQEDVPGIQTALKVLWHEGILVDAL